MIKKLAVAVFIVMIASLSIAGCTSTTSTNNSASSAGQASVAATQTKSNSNDLSSYFTDLWGHTGMWIVKTPFKKGINYRGNDVYTGIIQRSDRSANSDVTAVVELTKTKVAARSVFYADVAKLQKDGFMSRPDLAAKLNSEEGTSPADENWYGVSGYDSAYTFYEYNSEIGNYMVITEN